jgi:hypothetical protein
VSTWVSGRCKGCGGDVAVGGDAEADGLGAAGGAHVGLGEFAACGGEADLESLGFEGLAFAFRFGDAGMEVVADFFEAVPLGGVDSFPRCVQDRVLATDTKTGKTRAETNRLRGHAKQ